MRSRAWLLGAIALLSCEDLPQAPATGGFQERVVDAQIHHGQGVTAADLNRDGRLDLIAAFSGNDAVHAYAGPADPTEHKDWSRVEVSGFGNIVAMSVTTLDADGDGDLDIAATGLYQRLGGADSDGELHWYENPGAVDGRWLDHSVDLSLTGAYLLESGDLSGDGAPDLVVGTLGTDTSTLAAGVYWYEAGEAGRFFGPYKIEGLGGLDAIEVLDLDADGRLDVLAVGADGDGGLLRWYRNRPGEAGPRWVAYTLTRAVGSLLGLTAIQADGDRDLELALLRSDDAGGANSLLLLNRGALPADAWTEQLLATGLGAGAADHVVLRAADLNGDGAEDLALAIDYTSGALTTGALQIFLNDPTTWREELVRSGYRQSGLWVADVNADGRVDLITSSYALGTNDRLSWWENL